MSPYTPKRQARSHFYKLRGLDYHAHVWGEARAGQAPLLLVHGWMDVGASFQFLVDALADERHVIAPDWRGFGRTQAGACDSYWFPDYLGDLDALIDAVSPAAAVSATSSASPRGATVGASAALK